MEPEVLQIHRTPGRVRIRSSHLKQNPSRALDAKSQLTRLTGVHSVQLNALTGSLLIHFDPGISTPDSLLRVALCSRGGAPLGIYCAEASAQPRYSRAARKTAKLACIYAGEKLVEHLVSALFLALL